MATLLFFDDFYLNRWENLRRRIGQPELVPEATYSDPEFWLASAYPTVFRDASGIWRCLYQGKPRAEPQEQRYPLLLESDDGLRWQAPDLTHAVPLDERRFRNQVMPVTRFREWDCYFDARAEDPQERLKALVTHPSGTSLWTSADGRRWRELPGVRWRAGAPDPPSTAFWNELRNSYVISARPTPHNRPRRVAFSETRDWRTFTEPELILTCDALDTPLAEIYGMIVFPYEGKFVGLLWIFHVDPHIPNKYFGGATDCQLAYSYNGWHFQRTLREPLFPSPEFGAPGAGTLRPISLLVHERQIRIYSSASYLEHGHHVAGHDPGALLMHRLRLDGFVYLESTGGPGLLATRPLFLRSGDVRLNVQAAHEVRVQVTDPEGRSLPGYTFADAEPLRGDELFWTPRWRNRRLEELTRQVVCLEIRLHQARIYAVRGDFVPTIPSAARRYAETGTEPQFQPGLE